MPLLSDTISNDTVSMNLLCQPGSCSLLPETSSSMIHKSNTMVQLGAALLKMFPLRCKSKIVGQWAFAMSTLLLESHGERFSLQPSDCNFDPSVNSLDVQARRSATSTATFDAAKGEVREQRFLDVAKSRANCPIEDIAAFSLARICEIA